MDAPAFVVSITDMQPGDVVLIKSARPLPPEQVERAFKAIAEARDGKCAIVIGDGITIDIMRPTAGRPMERGDLFAGIGGWARAGCGECETNCIVWLTADEASRYVDCGLGSHVHRLDEVA